MVLGSTLRRPGVAFQYDSMARRYWLPTHSSCTSRSRFTVVDHTSAAASAPTLTSTSMSSRAMSTMPRCAQRAPVPRDPRLFAAAGIGLLAVLGRHGALDVVY